MNKRTIIISAFIVLGLVGLMFWGKSNKAVETSQSSGTTISSLLVSEKLYDFGTISMKNGLANHVFKVTNPSNKDVYVEKINTSCMCTRAYVESASGEKGPFGMEGMGYLPPANEVIKAGESRDIKVVYDPNAHGPAGVGTIDRFIYLTDASGNVLQFEIKAVVTP